jgi:hypothetical protein
VAARRGAKPWLARVPPRIQADVGGGSYSFRSKLEHTTAEDLEDRGVEWAYEAGRINYVKTHHYVPDFLIIYERRGEEEELIIEAKGWTPGWESGADRSKLLAVREQNPRVLIALLWDTLAFSRKPISKGAKMRNWEWAVKHSFPQAAEIVPEGWLHGDFG